ncbi:MAG TPA: glutaredoxin domain-containing protein [Verrucomicrobiae bacterium]|nr:glutaredoxin domain-containing protein [Verrucomicrobiae bacterium]
MNDAPKTTNKPQIIIYSTSWCGFCRSERQYLTEKNIPFVSKDIEQDPEAYHELMHKTGGQYVGVPMTDIGGDMILGFDRAAINQAIERHGIQPLAAA